LKLQEANIKLLRTHSTFDTFVEQGSATGYGVYAQHPNVFKPGDSMVLYGEPVGFAHKPVIDDKGNTLNQINLTDRHHNF
jgi:hypothetical protein